MTRQGDPLEQNYEPFMKVSTYGKGCSILSLFVVWEYEDELRNWEKTEDGWKIEYEEEVYVIVRQGDSFSVYRKGSSQFILIE